MYRYINIHISQCSFLVLLVSLLVFITSCATVPVTGRSQLSLIPSDSLLSMSFQQYSEFLQENKLSSNTQQTQMVKRVGTRIQSAVEQYFQQQNMSQELRNYQWEFNLVESEDVNAWCMPGGKVVVYTGILPITQDETGLAVVMGHEIAHAIAQHGNERMSQGLLLELGGMALSEALRSRPQKTQQLWMTAFGLGAQVGAILPYSRLHETEADRLGLIFMAMAGYDPRAAVDFWQRMAQAGGAGVPEFLSTHPSDTTRIRNIQNFIPEALQYYQGNTTIGPANTTNRPVRGGYRR
ncbi:peptidase, M48 family [Candidatus Vecturithrix granuli]|uniref:Peptidase, M48 family n=1 Tax=Vecturithrix granuli TaxID=1499967 RepID=A0A081BX39_VECG1|nr:peptidase, M48 family [Candidatus Vecturithrix granuli]